MIVDWFLVKDKINGIVPRRAYGSPVEERGFSPALAAAFLVVIPSEGFSPTRDKALELCFGF